MCYVHTSSVLPSLELNLANSINRITEAASSALTGTSPLPFKAFANWL